MAKSNRQYAKLTRPHLYGAVARGRLFSKIDDARTHRQAVFVVGPPGAGKTTLVASWLDARGIHGIWYQITPDDADIATFFHYLAEAARPFLRTGAQFLPAPTPERLQDVVAFARQFLRELFRRMPTPSVLVLDNYQDVPAQSELHQITACAVDELPDPHTLMIISRLEPSPEHMRLIANGRLCVMAWQDLRLTVPEASDIVRRRYQADDALIQRLHDRSDGWAGGLTLLLERMSIDGSEPGDALSVDAVFDYFNAEIFRVLPESTRDFLMATAHLPSVQIDIARQLTGDANAKEILERLHRRHLFTHRIAGKEITYQYHPMFREFLLRQSQERLDVEARHGLITKAASLMNRSGDCDSAVALYGAAEDWEQVALLVVQNAAELLSQGRWRTVQAWVQSLPSSQRDCNPWVRYWSGVSLAAVDVMRARDELERAFNLFQARDDALGQMLSASEILRAFFMEFRSFERVDPWIDLLGDLVSGGSVVPSAEMELRIYSGLLGALVSRRAKHPLIERCVQRTRALLEHQTDSNLVLTAGISICFYACMCGRLDLGEDVAAIVGPHLEADSVSPVLRVFWTGSYGYLRYIAGDPVAALRLFEEAEAVAQENGLAARVNFIRAWHAYCLRRVGRLDESEAIARQIEGWSTDIGSRRNVLWLRALNERTRGKLATAASMGAEALGGDRPSECTLHGAQQLQQAEMLLQAGLPDLARSWLEQAKEQIVGTFSEPSWLPVILLLEALSALRQDDPAGCHATLEEALRLLRGTGTLVFLRWFPYTLSQLLPVAFEAGIDTETACKLVRECKVPGRRSCPQNWPWPVRIYTLGRFEVEIDGQRLAFARKTPRRLITLLKAIVAFGAREVSERKLIDTLWPDELGDAAAHSLVVAIHRLRRLLGSPEVIQTGDGCVSLDESLVWTDVEQFERYIAGPQEDLGVALRALDLYHGEFLKEEADLAWTASTRERLRTKLLRCIEHTGRKLESKNRYQEAVTLYVRGLDSDPLSETFYQGLMRCYAGQDRRAEALSVYRRMRQQLSVVLGLPPSRTSQALARQLRL